MSLPMETKAPPSHPLLALLEQSRLGIRCLGALLRRSVAASSACAASKAAATPGGGTTKGGGSGVGGGAGNLAGNGAGGVAHDGGSLTKLLRVQVLRWQSGSERSDGAGGATHATGEPAAERLVRVATSSTMDGAALCHFLKQLQGRLRLTMATPPPPPPNPAGAGTRDSASPPCERPSPRTTPRFTTSDAPAAARPPRSPSPRFSAAAEALAALAAT